MERTLEQERAAFALEHVEQVNKNDSGKAKFKTQLIKLPSRLHSNGLGQTVAFYLSAGKDKPEWQICQWLEDWLGGGHRGIYSGRESLIHHIADQDEDLYREASAEARALAVWLKRFAEAFILGDSE
jgi:CRISPR-associated protein Cmr5